MIETSTEKASLPVVKVSEVQLTLKGSSVLLVQKALLAEGLTITSLNSNFDSKTLTAYSIWQRKCGLRGSSSFGSPDLFSLRILGENNGFDVTD